MSALDLLYVRRETQQSIGEANKTLLRRNRREPDVRSKFYGQATKGARWMPWQ